MDLSTSKIELAKLILEIDNQAIIDKITRLLKSEQNDFWEDLSEKQKKSVALGLKQLERGEGISLEDFLKKVS